MLPSRGTLAALLALPLLASGCSSELEPGPLVIDDGFGVVAKGRPLPFHATTEVCVKADGARRVAITHIEAVAVYGDGVPEFRIAWSYPTDHGPRSARGYRPIPEEYVSTVGEGGTVGQCSRTTDSSDLASLAVIVPSDDDEPVVVNDVEVTYAIGDEEYRTVADIYVAHCPPGEDYREDWDDGEPDPCE
ncbi:hypothetical protein [Nocardioides sp. YIM 152588]|uniref:hypothetical protein n=1 Tax=Nocardioides sp. YIM 152588 TaxID=3158259 RepID=UPI0032E5205A